MRIALAGRSGSGKSWVAQHLIRRHGFALASTGDICRQISNLLFGNEDKATLNRVSEMVRCTDQSLFITAALRAAVGDRVVLDSVRYRSDIDAVRDRGFCVWHIVCRAEVRQDRLRERGQVMTSVDTIHPSEVELEDAAFDRIIDNSSGRGSDLEKQIDSLIES